MNPPEICEHCDPGVQRQGAVLRSGGCDVVGRREGCFRLTSSRDMDASEALKIYRSKDAVEKLFHSLKSEIEFRPPRVWSDDAVYGVLQLGLIAQLTICTLFCLVSQRPYQRNSSLPRYKIRGSQQGPHWQVSWREPSGSRPGNRYPGARFRAPRMTCQNLKLSEKRERQVSRSG